MRKRVSKNPIQNLSQQQSQEQSEDEIPIAKKIGSIKK